VLRLRQQPDAFTGRSSYADNCQGADIASLNNARTQMDDPAHPGSKLPAYALPANFTSMPVADQILLLVNQDRAAYGNAAYVGFNAELNNYMDEPRWVLALHRTTVNPDGTKTLSAIASSGFVSNMAGNRNPLLSYYVWTYDDGYGSGNGDCKQPTDSGCWGQRQTGHSHRRGQHQQPHHRCRRIGPPVTSERAEDLTALPPAQATKQAQQNWATPSADSVCPAAWQTNVWKILAVRVHRSHRLRRQQARTVITRLARKPSRPRP
jgi:hypothetical protein